ncbi:MAG: baseplate J/gp47 family protein [Cypionkella sp.]
MALPSELANLPPPIVVNEIGYEAGLAALRARAVSIFQDAGVLYDTAELETDPVQVLLQVAAYADMLLRQRINEAIQANLLAFATAGDLDHLAQFYDVVRLSGETDDALRIRVVLNIRGRSTGGTEPRYRSVALGVPGVADAAVYVIGRSPIVHVAVFSTANAGIADAPLLAAVDAAMQNPAVRMVNDTIVVAGASNIATPITANIWLLPETSASILTQMQTSLQAAWATSMGLGRDVTRSWLISKLMLDGVQKVEITSPAADIIVPFDQAAALGAITLNNQGRAY